MEWNIVIPSYNRAEGFIKKTLATLQYHCIPPERIWLFVADEQQREEYSSRLQPGSVGHIIVGMKGLTHIRNFIFNYFPIGTPLVSFDDDVRGFVRLEDTKLRPLLPEELTEVIDLGFKECSKKNARFWGGYPIPNGFYMNSTITRDLKFIIGSFWGCINPGSAVTIDIGTGEKEDYQRAIHFWELDKNIIRINFISHKTATYNESGGLQSDGKAARIMREKNTVEAMLQRWPHYIRMNTRRKSDYPEILFKKHKA